MESRQRLQTLGRLTAAVAHEFNNVLEPIILFTEEAIQSLPPDSLARADLERVLASARRGKTLAQRILAFSDVPAATVLRPTDLRSVVAESISLYSALMPRGIEIRSEIAANLYNAIERSGQGSRALSRSRNRQEFWRSPRRRIGNRDDGQSFLSGCRGIRMSAQVR
jgi:signal transduction histidine kinase